MTVNWNQGKYLFASSGLFAIPAVYSYFRGFIIYPYLNSSIALSSMIFWINPNSYIGRNINGIVTHVGCIYYIVDGCRNITEEGTVVSMLCLGNIFYHYIYSHILFNCENKNWWKFHIMFHLHVIFQQMLILYHL